MRLKKIYWYIKCSFGFGSVNDGSICWFSRKYYDVHDYPIHKGGDDYPTHFIKYTCHKCGEDFGI